MLSISGFTATSETILGWNDDIPQVREAVDYVLAPEILTEPGSDQGAALRHAISLFDDVPAEYQEQEHRKFLILLSDGERTVGDTDLLDVLAELRSEGVKVLALQVGMLDTPEGLPEVDEAGLFQGFQEVGGQTYTNADPEMMSLLAGNQSGGGLYVRAENSGAVDQISEFLGMRTATALGGSLYLGVILALTGLSFLILLRLA